MSTVSFLVVYYSSTGSVHRLAEAAAVAAGEEGADVRLRKVAELAPAEVVDSVPAWRAHAEATAAVPVVTRDDLTWADAALFGTPSRYGNVASQLQQFLDTTGPLWEAGQLSDKVYGAFVSSATAHGGQETTLLHLITLFHHWGGVLVPPGFTAPIQFQAGNPYGASHVSGEGEPGEVELQSAAYQARRMTEFARRLAVGRVLEAMA